MTGGPGRRPGHAPAETLFRAFGAPCAPAWKPGCNSESLTLVTASTHAARSATAKAVRNHCGASSQLSRLGKCRREATQRPLKRCGGEKRARPCTVARAAPSWCGQGLGGFGPQTPWLVIDLAHKFAHRSDSHAAKQRRRTNTQQTTDAARRRLRPESKGRGCVAVDPSHYLRDGGCQPHRELESPREPGRPSLAYCAKPGQHI